MLHTMDITPADSPAGVPLIGYKNAIVSYSATSAAVGHPASNMGNPATSSTWQSTSSAAQKLTMNMAGAKVNYLALAKHNLFDTSALVNLGYTDNIDAVNGNLTTLLHFDAADATTSIIDSSGLDEQWQAMGNAQIDTAQSKFGGSSCLFPSGAFTDYLQAAGSVFAFGTNAFTIDFWIRFNSIATSMRIIDTRLSLSATAYSLVFNFADATLRFTVASTDQIISSASAIAVGTWYHVAISRSGGNTRLFINGVQAGSTYADANNYDVTQMQTYGKIGTRFDATAAGLNGWIDELRIVNGVGYYTANFTPPAVPWPDGIRSVGTFQTLLHFDGANNSTTFTDSGGENHSWLAFGNPHIDTSQSKFGGASCRFSGGNNWLKGDTSKSFVFGTGDFTIDFWIRFNTINVGVSSGYLYDDGFDGIRANAMLLYVNTASKIELWGMLIGTSVMTTGVWHHIALSRQAGTTRLFVDGNQEASAADSRNYAPTTVAGFYADGVFPHLGYNTDAWMEELRILKGTALYTRNFLPPPQPAHSMSQRGRFSADDAAPIIFRFPTVTPQYLVANLSSALTGVHIIAVMYAGELLVLERGVKVDVQHDVLEYARENQVTSGMSESGQFLGRVVMSEWREAQADFAWFTPTWYRANFEPFVKAALQTPFFWVWNPNDYPAETSYAWISDDVMPETDPTTRRVAATISMRATA